MNSLCSHERLKLALAGRLDANEESMLQLHLDDCEHCSAELERLSGGEQASREIASMLISDELDEALPLRDDCSVADFVVDHLEPSDSPESLGKLGGYDILEIIGRGGMGIVLKGYDRELKRFVAIKALAPHLAHSALARKRFAREAQAAAAVVNLHVIAIHQVQPNGKLPYLVMPLLTGESLAQRLKAKGALDLAEVLRVGMQAAEGLAAAHAQGLIHRDVKPANILLEKGVERAVLTDFGLARAADDVSMTRMGIIAGTPEYMSPEQARGETLDSRSDLFSLGCVLYEMATGVSPFRTDSTLATLRRIVDEQPAAIASLAPELPPWFCQVVERLLSKEPPRRFASASEVSRVLEQCLSHLQQPASVALPRDLETPTSGFYSRVSSMEKAMTAKLYTDIDGARRLHWLRIALISAIAPCSLALIAIASGLRWSDGGLWMMALMSWGAFVGGIIRAVKSVPAKQTQSVSGRRSVFNILRIGIIAMTATLSVLFSWLLIMQLAGTPDQPAAQDDADSRQSLPLQSQLQGKWRLIAWSGCDRRGQMEYVPDPANDRREIVFHENELELKLWGEDSGRLKFTLDTSSSPASIDITSDGQIRLGLIELNDGTLRLAFDPGTDPERPKALGAKPGVDYYEFRRAGDHKQAQSTPNADQASANAALLERLQGRWTVKRWMQARRFVTGNDDLEYSFVFDRDRLYQIGRSKRDNGKAFHESRSWGRVEIHAEHNPPWITVTNDDQGGLTAAGVFELHGDDLRLAYVPDLGVLSQNRPQSFEPSHACYYLECSRAHQADGPDLKNGLSSGLIFGDRSSSKATDREGRLICPRYPMQMTFYTGRIHPKYAFAASCVGKDNQPELSGKVNCLLPGSIATVEWKFTGYAGLSDEYDSYQFTITPPPEVSDGAPKSINVQFDGTQAIPFENLDCVLMLERPRKPVLPAAVAAYTIPSPTAELKPQERTQASSKQITGPNQVNFYVAQTREFEGSHPERTEIDRRDIFVGAYNRPVFFTDQDCVDSDLVESPEGLLGITIQFSPGAAVRLKELTKAAPDALFAVSFMNDSSSMFFCVLTHAAWRNNVATFHGVPNANAGKRIVQAIHAGIQSAAPKPGTPIPAATPVAPESATQQSPSPQPAGADAGKRVEIELPDWAKETNPPITTLDGIWEVVEVSTAGQVVMSPGAQVQIEKGTWLGFDPHENIDNETRNTRCAIVIGPNNEFHRIETKTKHRYHQPGRYLLVGDRLWLAVQQCQLPSEAPARAIPTVIEENVTYYQLKRRGAKSDPAMRPAADVTNTAFASRPSLEVITRAYNAQTTRLRRDLFQPPIPDLSIDQMKAGLKKAAEVQTREGRPKTAKVLQDLAEKGTLPQHIGGLVGYGTHEMDENGETVSRLIVPTFVIAAGDVVKFNGQFDESTEDVIVLTSLSLLYSKDGYVSKQYEEPAAISNHTIDRKTNQ